MEQYYSLPVWIYPSKEIITQEIFRFPTTPGKLKNSKPYFHPILLSSYQLHSLILTNYIANLVRILADCVKSYFSSHIIATPWVMRIQNISFLSYSINITCCTFFKLIQSRCH